MSDSLHHPKCDCTMCVELRKESYARERAAIARGSGEAEAVATLRQMLVGQPALQWFFTAQPHIEAMVPELQRLGYLGDERLVGRSSPFEHCTYWPLTDKAKRELTPPLTPIQSWADCMRS